MQRRHTLDWAWNVHTTVWNCDIDHAQIPEELDKRDFDDKDEFLQHLSKAHGEKLSRPQILARGRRGKTSRIRETFTCPFCDCQPDEIVPHVSERPYDLLSVHIARHLKALAFISLSHLDSIEDYPESSGSEEEGSQQDEVAPSVRDDSFDDVPPTVANGSMKRVGDEIFDDLEELEEAIMWDHLPVKDFPGPDATLERFAAAMSSEG